MTKKAWYMVLLICFTVFCKVKAQVPLFLDEDSTNIHLDTTKSTIRVQAKKVVQPNSTQKADKIDSLIDYAHTFMGNRYRRGGTGATGFDCSGFTMTVFKQFGIKLPHTSAGQSLVGLEVPQKNIQKGDLVFFRGGNRRSRRIGHVGIVISERGEPVRFIHSSTSEGIRIDQLSAPYYKYRYLKAVRINGLYH